MARRRIARNTKDVLGSALLLAGEIAYDSSTGRFRQGDGATVGGHQLVRMVDTVPIVREEIVLTAHTVMTLTDFADAGRITLGAYNLTIDVGMATTKAGIFNENGAGRVTLVNGYARPEWWVNGSVLRAHDALPSDSRPLVIECPRGAVLAGDCAYAATTAAARYISKPNLWLKGAEKPGLTDDCRALAGGSRLLGTLLAFADNLIASDLGGDRGDTVCTALFNGAADDGLAFSYASLEQKTANAVRRGLTVRNCIGLGKNPTVEFHGLLVEGYAGVWLDNADGVYTINPLVIKASGVRGPGGCGMLGGSSLALIKSGGETTSQAVDIDLGALTLLRDGPEGSTPHTLPGANPMGLAINPEEGAVSDVHVGIVRVRGAVSGGVRSLIGPTGHGDIEKVVIDVLEADLGASVMEPPAQGLALESADITVAVDITIGRIDVRGGTRAVLDALSDAGLVRIGTVRAKGCRDVAVQSTGTNYVGAGGTYSDMVIEQIIADDCGKDDGTEGGALRMNFDARPHIGGVVLRGHTAKVFCSNGPALQVPVLIGAWTELSGSTFKAGYAGGRATLSGRVVPNGTGQVPVGIPPCMRPVDDVVLSAIGNNAGTVAAVAVTIKANGNVTVNETAGGGTTNCTTWLDLSGLSWDVAA